MGQSEACRNIPAQEGETIGAGLFRASSMRSGPVPAQGLCRKGLEGREAQRPPNSTVKKHPVLDSGQPAAGERGGAEQKKRIKGNMWLRLRR